MTRGLYCALIGICAWLAGVVAAEASTASAPAIAWASRLDSDVFREAARQHRFVLLDLHAVWCHWCHVMDEETYSDSRIQALIAKRYLPVSVDADSDPALTSRYGNWGWPATIVLAPDGTEIVKRRGCIPALQMASLLQAIIDDPTPGPSVDRAARPTGSATTRLNGARRATFLRSFDTLYDDTHGGWGEIHKFIDAPTIEFAFGLIDRGDSKAEPRVRQTLDANLNLIDSVWGGVYQYSDTVDWRSPHFEKLMSFQADDLRIYSAAYARWQDTRYLVAAQALRDYMEHFLSADDGAFYVSQDADLSVQVTGHEYYALSDDGRRRLGLPRVDTHEYSRETGWAIRALCQFYDVTGQTHALKRASRAAEWAIAHRSLVGGGFRHDETDRGGPFLDDSVAMGEGFLALYRSTGDRAWLGQVEAVLTFIAIRLRDPTAGFVAEPVSTKARGVFRNPVRAIDQNVAVARLANLAYRYTGTVRYRQLALHAMRFLSTVSGEDEQLHADVLTADGELGTTPTHITVVGAKSDPAARALHAEALKFPASYLQVDWWDRAEGPLPNPAVRYPVLPVAAAFVCSENSCSTPIYEAGKVRAAVLLSRETD